MLMVKPFALLTPLLALTLFKKIAWKGYLYLVSGIWYLVMYSTVCTAAPILTLNLSRLFLKAHETSVLEEQNLLRMSQV